MRERFGSTKPPHTFTCPHCGEDVAVGAASCRACGSDAETGWSDGSDGSQRSFAQGSDSDDGFDYDDFVRREFGNAEWRLLGYSKRQWQAIIASLLVLAFLYLMIR